MRTDMFEVLIERPRGGGQGSSWRKGRRKEVAQLHPERAPLMEPMSIGRGTKHLNENLAPLRRFLLSSVGRPWNTVHAEICARISAQSAVQKHVLDHVNDMVEKNAVVIDGRPCRPAATGFRRDMYSPVGRFKHGLYVCPRTGILRLAEGASRRKKPKTPQAHDAQRIDETTEARRIAGIWYLTTFAAVPKTPAELRTSYDVVLKVHLHPEAFQSALWQAYGRTDRYALAKRQLSKREIRALGLS